LKEKVGWNVVQTIFWKNIRLIEMSNWFKTYMFHWEIIESHSYKLYKWFWKYKRKEALKFINIKSIFLLRWWWKQNIRIILLNDHRSWTKFTRKHKITPNRARQKIPKTT
jgi:hypothetical protein